MIMKKKLLETKIEILNKYKNNASSKVKASIEDFLDKIGIGSRNKKVIGGYSGDTVANTVGVISGGCLYGGTGFVIGIVIILFLLYIYCVMDDINKKFNITRNTIKK